MPSTPIGLPYPNSSDPVANGAQDIQDLAEAVDSKLRILQVVYGGTTTEVSNSTSTFTDTGLTATITPQATSSKVLVIIAQQAFKNNANAENRVNIKTFRGATEIATSGGLFLYTGTAIFGQATYSLCVLDNPATTSAVTYKTQAMNPNNTASITTQVGPSLSTMILMEVSA